MKKCCTKNGAHVFEPRYTQITSPDIDAVKSIIDRIEQTDFMGKGVKKERER